AHRRGIVHAELFHEEREHVPAGVTHEAVEHPLAGDDGEVAVRAPVKRTRGAEIGSGALELDVLANDPYDVRRLADLLDHVVEDGGGRWRAAEGEALRARFNSSNDIHPSLGFSPAVPPAVSSSALSTSRRASLAVASWTAARARPSASSTFLRASSR